MMNIDEMPAGRELDALVAEKVMGWRFIPLPKHNQYGLCDWCGRTVPADQHGREKERGICDGLCQFSTDINAAWTVVLRVLELAKIHERIAYYELVYRSTGACANFTGSRDDYQYGAFSECGDDRTKCQALAICRAAIARAEEL